MWGWFRRLKQWQRYYIAGCALGLTLTLLLIVDWLVLGQRFTTGAPDKAWFPTVAVIAILGWYLDRRARFEFVKENPHLRWWVFRSWHRVPWLSISAVLAWRTLKRASFRLSTARKKNSVD